MTIEQMSTADLVAALRELVKVEKRVGKDILFHLLELDRRGMFVEEAYSIATYCIEELGMDERSAGRRAKAVGMMKRFPIVIGYLREEALTLVTLERLDGVLTDANASEVVEAVSYLPEADVRVFLTCEMDVEMKWRMVLHIGRAFQEKLDRLRGLASHIVPSGSAVDLI